MPKSINTESAFFRLALDNCPDLVFVKDANFRLTYANKAMLELYHPDIRSSIIGSTTIESFTAAESEAFLAADYETLEIGHTKRIENIGDYLGRQRVFSTVKNRFTDQNGQAFILGVSTDITLIVERGDRLRRTNQALERYADNVAHDMASPLHSLSMIGEMIAADPHSTLSAATQQRLQDSLNIVAGLGTQVRALLLICKAESASAVDREIVQLDKLVDTVRLLLSAHLSAADAVIHCHSSADLACNPPLVEALLQNLVENSLKYRSHLAAEITIAHSLQNEEDIITVTDNGTGVPPELSDRLFSSQLRLDHGKDGVGLGMIMCKNIVELHRGRIWIEKHDGVGTRVSFSLGRR